MALNTIADLSTTAASNTDFLGTTTTGSGNASDIDVVRQNFAAIMARFYGDFGGQGTVGGSANAITLTSISTYQTLEGGLRVVFKAASANTTAATLNMDSLGAKAIRLQGDTALSGGEIKANGYYEIVYDTAYNAAAGAWVLMNPSTYVAGGTDVAVADGGTGASTASDARTNLGLVIGTDVLGPASQAQMEAASSNAVAVTPGRTKNHPGVAKAWGYVTYSGGTPTLQTSTGVTSISDAGTGRLGVTFSTAFSSTSYAVFATAHGPSGSAPFLCEISSTTAMTTTTCEIFITQSSTLADPIAVSFVAYGDQ